MTYDEVKELMLEQGYSRKWVEACQFLFAENKRLKAYLAARELVDRHSQRSKEDAEVMDDLRRELDIANDKVHQEQANLAKLHREVSEEISKALGIDCSLQPFIQNIRSLCSRVKAVGADGYTGYRTEKELADKLQAQLDTEQDRANLALALANELKDQLDAQPQVEAVGWGANDSRGCNSSDRWWYLPPSMCHKGHRRRVYLGPAEPIESEVQP